MVFLVPCLVGSLHGQLFFFAARGRRVKNDGGLFSLLLLRERSLSLRRSANYKQPPAYRGRCAGTSPTGSLPACCQASAVVRVPVALTVKWEQQQASIQRRPTALL